jgi:metal-responsive CopG/Arc/MetJ family transcriptional regulator
VTETPKRRPGRPEVGGRVTVSLGDERLARLDAAAELAGVTRAEILRRVIDAALAGRPVDADA